MKAFDDWLSEIPTKHVAMIPQSNLALTIHELSSCRVGITGSNLFVVTYPVLANVRVYPSSFKLSCPVFDQNQYYFENIICRLSRCFLRILS